MRNFDLRKLQLVELEILQEVERLCQKYDITYYLAWGSALGAKRHQGFIPWDDDIDICMPWTDYIRFQEVCKTELGKDFFYQDNSKEPDFYLYWAKLRKNNTTSMTRDEIKLHMHWGICIDVFPLFALKDNRVSFSQKVAYHVLKFLCNRSFTFNCPRSLKNTIKRILYYMIPMKVSNGCKNYCFKVLSKYEKEGMYLMDFSEGCHQKVLPRDVFAEGMYLDFEGQKFPVPKKIDEYLTFAYGDDYMVIPDVHDQMNHGDIIVDFDHDSSRYQNNKI